jgi:hypothetical protein
MKETGVNCTELSEMENASTIFTKNKERCGLRDAPSLRTPFSHTSIVEAMVAMQATDHGTHDLVLGPRHQPQQTSTTLGEWDSRIPAANSMLKQGTMKLVGWPRDSNKHQG